MITMRTGTLILVCPPPSWFLDQFEHLSSPVSGLLIEQGKLGWAPIMKLKDGLRITYCRIKEHIEKEKNQEKDVSMYGSSKVVGTQALIQLGSLRCKKKSLSI